MYSPAQAQQVMDAAKRAMAGEADVRAFLAAEGLPADKLGPDLTPQLTEVYLTAMKDKG